LVTTYKTTVQEFFPEDEGSIFLQNTGNVRNIGQGEARHRKYKRLKLGGGQAYDRSND
jgi:hypothetical protein